MMPSILVKLRPMSFLLELIFITMLFVISIVPDLNYLQNANAAYVKAKPTSGGPSVNDPNLKVENVFKNSGKLDTPTTSMAFLGANDILVLEKNKGTVQRIIDGQLQANPILEVKVGNEIEWGMLGIAVSKNDTKTYVFLFYTELDGGQKVLGNRLYRYELVDDKLVNPLLLLDLPGYT